jgi:hypothetical protein
MRAQTDDNTLPDWPVQIMGVKYARMLQRHVSQLRQSDPHGNRKLFYDDVVIMHLLAFFNPTLKSLRTIEDFSQTRLARKHLTPRKLCRSTLSDFHRLCEPSRLEPIVEQLRSALRRRRGNNATPVDLPEEVRQLVAVDGSFFGAAADVAWAVQHSTNTGRKRASVRLDLSLNVVNWTPVACHVSGVRQSESEQAIPAIQPGAIHIYDRGIFSFKLLVAHAEQKSFFVNRIRTAGRRCPNFVAEEERPLTKTDCARGVISDRIGRMPGSAHCPGPELRLREIIIRAPDEPGGQIRLITNLLDVEAQHVGIMYRYRWQVELFFRWLKVFANFNHLITHSREGVLLSFYVAVIGVLLIYLHTDAKPSKYAFSLLSLVASGGATLEEISPILRERERQIAVARARLARKRAETSK